MRKNVKKVLKKGKKGVIKCMNIKSIEKKWNILRKILEYIKNYQKQYQKNYQNILRNIIKIIKIY